MLCVQRGISKKYVQKKDAAHQNVHLEQAGTIAIKVCKGVHVYLPKYSYRNSLPIYLGKGNKMELYLAEWQHVQETKGDQSSSALLSCL